MSDLHERLNSAFAAVEPGTAPVEAAMRTGRKIRTRRRAGLLAGTVAVIAAAVVGVPAFTHHAALAPAPATSHIRVTVNPPGPHAPAGLIASGLVGTKPWNLSVQSPTTKNCMFGGEGLSFYACNGSLPSSDAAEPITFDGAGEGDGPNAAFVSFGVAWKGVVSARVDLSDGTVLTLHPVEVDGVRFVAFATPAHLAVDAVTAYSRTGEIATAIPFNAPDGHPTFSAWLRPGQARPPQFTGTFGSGTVATAYLGPWGVCLETKDGGDCTTLTRQSATSMLGASSSVVFGTAAESVSYVTITRKDGSTLRAVPTAVGPHKFWAVPLAQSEQTGGRWTAYNADGRQVASGSLS